MRLRSRNGVRTILFVIVLMLSSVMAFSSLASDQPTKVTVALEFGEKHSSFASLFYEKINSNDYPFTRSGSRITFQIENGKTIADVESYIYEAAEKKNGSFYLAENEKIDNGEYYMITGGLFHLQPLSDYTRNEDRTTPVKNDLVLYAHWAVPVGAVSVEIEPLAVGTEVSYGYPAGMSIAYSRSDPSVTARVTGHAIQDTGSGNNWYTDAQFETPFTGTVTENQTFYATVYVKPEFGYYFANTNEITVTNAVLKEKKDTEWTNFVKLYVELAPCTITFSANGGEGKMDSVIMSKGMKYKLPECEFTAPKNQLFKEWSVKIGTEDPVAKAAGEEFTVAADTTVTAVWKDMEQVATPILTPAAGIFTGLQDVEISCETDGAKIFYTTDGTDPTKESKEYTGAITLTETTMIKAMATKTGMTDSATASEIYTIHKTIIAEASDYTGVYDGKEHGIDVVVTKPTSGATIRYGTEKDKCTLTVSPTITNVNESPLTVWYQITADGYETLTGSATVTIKQSKAVVTTIPTMITGLVYNQEAQKLITAGEAEGGTMIYAIGADGTTAPETAAYTAEIPTGTDAGIYYVWCMAKGDDSHIDSVPVCIPGKIAGVDGKIPATVKTRPEAKTDLVYTGSAQELVTAGAAEGGAMAYALGTDATSAPEARAYIVSIPTGIDAETYYVWYKVVGDANHSDSDAVCVIVTIEKEEPDPSTPPIPVIHKDVKFDAEVTTKGKNKLVLKWAGVEKPEKYEVYFSKNGSNLKLYKTVNPDVTEWTFKKLDKEKIYKMQVKAYITENGEKKYIGHTDTLYCIAGGGDGHHTNAVKIKTKDQTIAEGEKKQLKVTLKGEEKGLQILSHGGAVHYESGNPDIATVDKDGKVKGVGVGSCKIQLSTVNGLRKTIVLTVKAGPKEMRFGKKKYKVEVGETLNLKRKLKIYPKDAEVSLKWESSDKSIAKVDKNGKVTARKKGTVKITVTASNGVSMTVKVKVK